MRLDDVPDAVLIASLPQMAEPLIRHTYALALSRAKLRQSPKRLRFVEAKLGAGGFKLTIVPKGPLVRLLDRGTKAHSIVAKHLRADTISVDGQTRTVIRGALPIPAGSGHVYRRSASVRGVTGKHFMPEVLLAAWPEILRILERNLATYLERAEAT